MAISGSNNILRRIANNHAVSFEISAYSWDDVGGVILTGHTEEENMRISSNEIIISREQLENAAHPEILLTTVLETMLDQLEEEKMNPIDEYIPMVEEMKQMMRGEVKEQE